MLYADREIERIFVELPKFTKSIEQLETLSDRWIYFRKYARSLTEIPETMDEIPEIYQALEFASQANLSREEIKALEGRSLLVIDQQGALSLGRQQGFEEGREEGRRETLLAITRNSLDRLDYPTISQITGLSIEEIHSLRATDS